MGSKARHATGILAAIITDLDARAPGWMTTPPAWVEPFVGGANMIDKVSALFPVRIGADINRYVVEMFKAVQSGWLPPFEISEIEYKTIRDNLDNPLYNPALVGFVAIGCSYSGKWFGGYARGNAPCSGGRPRNYCLESRENLLKQSKSLVGVDFQSGDYLDFQSDEKVILYCDPPYAGTTGYKNEFSSERFWTWAAEQARIGHLVYVSEYAAPEGWDCIWKKDCVSSLTKNTGSKRAVEKLFTLSLEKSLAE